MAWTNERRKAQSDLMKSLNARGVNKTHGLSKGPDNKNTRLFKIWRGIKTRCLNTKVQEYPRYGGKGVLICVEWVDDYKTFHEWSMANGYSSELSIDRIDPNGNYEPRNCRWVDCKTQANNRVNTLKFEVNGEIRPLSELASEYRIPYPTLHMRLNKYKWSLAKSLMLPVQQRQKSKIEEEK
jgi:hypothetical protein